MKEGFEILKRSVEGGAESSPVAVIAEEQVWLDYDVDPHRVPVKGNPEDLKYLRHRGTV